MFNDDFKVQNTKIGVPGYVSSSSVGMSTYIFGFCFTEFVKTRHNNLYTSTLKRAHVLSFVKNCVVGMGVTYTCKTFIYTDRWPSFVLKKLAKYVGRRGGD